MSSQALKQSALLVGQLVQEVECWQQQQDQLHQQQGAVTAVRGHQQLQLLLQQVAAAAEAVAVVAVVAVVQGCGAAHTVRPTAMQ